MPYVPSMKSVPPAQDREILDWAVELLSRETADKITDNSSMVKIYKKVFMAIVKDLKRLLKGKKEGKGAEGKLARDIFEVSIKYDYGGAYLGELNYAINQFLQRLPQVKVDRGDWEEKEELRYWHCAASIEALALAEKETLEWELGIGGVFRNIKDEYYWKVIRPYEIAQTVKNGDCHFTPYYMRLVEMVDEDGKLIGHIEIPLKRTDKTLDKNILDYQLVLRKKIYPGKKSRISYL